MFRKRAVFTVLASAALAVGAAVPSWAASAPMGRAGGQPTSFFNDVSCAGAGFCAAVGASYTDVHHQASLAEIWNGQNWTARPTPYKPGGSVTQWLQSVSCSSASFCVAAGDYQTAVGFQHGFVETWNGTAWTGQALPEPRNSAVTTVLDASCTAPDSCVAVGNELPNGEYTEYGPNRSVAWQWNGTAWRILSVLNLAKKGTATGFTQVSCTSATACTALGQYPLNEPDSYQTQVAARWNGTGWTIQPIASKAGSPSTGLGAVSCTTAASCLGAGAYASGTNGSSSTAVAERWNGTAWRLYAVPQPAGALGTGLTDVSCTAMATCTAIGGYSTTHDGGKPVALFERWNGTTWRIQPSPAVAGQVYLGNIACATATACTAVGYVSTGLASADRTLAEAWNGTTWTVQVTPVLARNGSG